MNRQRFILLVIAAVVALIDIAGLGLIGARAIAPTSKPSVALAIDTPTPRGAQPTAPKPAVTPTRAGTTPTLTLTPTPSATATPTPTVTPTVASTPTPTITPTVASAPTPLPFQQTTINVPARQQQSLGFTLARGEVFEGNFTVQGGSDIGFRVQGLDGQAATSARVQGKYEFRWPVSNPASITLVFDNSYSLLTAKQIVLQYRIVR